MDKNINCIMFVDNINELSKTIDKYLIPQELEKKQNAEISTPYQLRQDMINKIPIDFWNSPKKVFEPCSGKGGFLIDIIDMFMKHLQFNGNNKEKYKFIVEECLYFSDINPTNIFIDKLLLDPFDEYKLNYNEGNTLELNINEKWNIDGFNAVIGNPPYNSSGNVGTGNTIWQYFTKKALNNWLLIDGYLLFVHPSLWRKPASDKSKLNGYFELMTSNNMMIYLEIHNATDGMKIFKCGTRYDWYLIQKKINDNYDNDNNTIIIDEDGVKNIVNLTTLEWLPNSNIELITNMISTTKNNCLDILCNFSYSRLNKDFVSSNKSKVFRYPLIYLTPSTGVRKMYSKVNNKGHFGVSKVIIGETGVYNSLNDFDGKYGMTQDSFGIIIKSYNEGENILRAIKSEKFIKLLKNSCSWSNFRIDWRLFTYLKKDFWKEFIEEHNDKLIDRIDNLLNDIKNTIKCIDDIIKQ